MHSEMITIVKLINISSSSRSYVCVLCVAQTPAIYSQQISGMWYGMVNSRHHAVH